VGGGGWVGGWWVGGVKLKLKLNSAQLTLELGLSLAKLHPIEGAITKLYLKNEQAFHV
jgi:hypothetical protein